MDGLGESEMREIAVCAPCTSCTHWHRDVVSRSCDAFGRIPDEIWLYDNPHTEPFEGDRGIQFEAIDG